MKHHMMLNFGGVKTHGQKFQYGVQNANNTERFSLNILITIMFITFEIRHDPYLWDTALKLIFLKKETEQNRNKNESFEIKCWTHTNKNVFECNMGHWKTRYTYSAIPAEG